MKEKEHSLLYHTMHSRPMPGCLPLFFLLAMGVVGLGIWLAPVEMPERLRPSGVGKVYVKNDRLTDFVVRRKSPLPLHLPLHADPEYLEDAAAASMVLLRPAEIQTPPPNVLFAKAADSAVLDAEALLALPGEPAPAAVAEPVPAAAETAPKLEADAEPVFHPGVEKEPDEEEVQP